MGRKERGGDKGTRGQGEGGQGEGGQGDKRTRGGEKKRLGDFLSPPFPAPLSPCLPFPLSSCPLLTASVDGNCRAVNRAGAFGGQKQYHVGDGFRRDPFAEIGVGHRRSVLRRVDYRRHYAVNVDASIFQFRVHAFGQTDDGGLRRAVSRVPRVSVQGGA